MLIVDEGVFTQRLSLQQKLVVETKPAKDFQTIGCFSSFIVFSQPQIERPRIQFK